MVTNEREIGVQFIGSSRIIVLTLASPLLSSSLLFSLLVDSFQSESRCVPLYFLFLISFLLTLPHLTQGATFPVTVKGPPPVHTVHTPSPTQKTLIIVDDIDMKQSHAAFFQQMTGQNGRLGGSLR